MIELLESAAAGAGRTPAVIADAREVSYAELLDDALAFAAGLRERGIERFAIAHQDAATVVSLLAAASLVGAEACVYPPIERPGHAEELARRFDHAVVVSDRTGFESGLEALSPVELRADHTAPVVAGGEARPLLVLTTGTTGAPRGARHDWNRVLRSVTHVVPARSQRWLLAYGLQQFGGLQVLIHCAAAGATLVAPFPRRPLESLAAMRAHRVTHASATPTFWRFLVAELRSDGGPVPALEQITLGGEAVPSRVLESLAEVFPQARISQIYGTTEFGNPRSVRDRRGGLPASMLDREGADIALRIVDGELWMRSSVGMLGYYGEPPIDPDGWRPTGDLVELSGDRILFRGRASEIINVGGVKVHPLPIEERIGAVGGVQLARVHGRPNSLTGAIVAVEVVLVPGADQEAIDAEIRAACQDLPAAARPRSIRFVEAIAVTGQKVKRGATT